ncbi:hypothetical protein SFRURICE_011139 [Spodoptera frugiperda]|nr:hypothetical protein SFRURICE_011139 [Spodoptera frugiperda]
MKEVIIQAAKENAVHNTLMKNFITKDTERAITERRILKEKGLISEEDHQRYSDLSAEIQRRCRRDKTDQINNLCEELERNSLKHQTKDLFQKVKDLTRTCAFKTCSIKAENGVLLTNVKQLNVVFRDM